MSAPSAANALGKGLDALLAGKSSKKKRILVYIAHGGLSHANVCQYAKRINDNNVQMVIVGLGSRFDPDEVKCLASKEGDEILSADDFSGIKTIELDTIPAVCEPASAKEYKAEEEAEEDAQWKVVSASVLICGAISVALAAAYLGRRKARAIDAGKQTGYGAV